MQEIRHDGSSILTSLGEDGVRQLMTAAADPRNREVRVLPDINNHGEYYIIKKRGKWVKRRK